MSTGQLGTAQARGVEGLPFVGQGSQGMAWRDAQMAPPDAFTPPPHKYRAPENPIFPESLGYPDCGSTTYSRKSYIPRQRSLSIHDLLLGSGCLAVQPIMAR